MRRFVVRRLVGMVVGPVRRLGPRLPDLQRDPRTRDPAQRMAGKNATPAAGRRASPRNGASTSPLPAAVPDDDGEGLHRRPDLLRRAAKTSTTGSSKGIPATFSLCIGAAVIWMFFGVLFGYLSAMRAGRLARPGADRSSRSPASRSRSSCSRAGPAQLPHLQDRDLPRRRLREADRRPGRMGLPPDPALDHARGHSGRLLQPGAALEHARRDGRGLRAHRAGQGAERATGDDAGTCCATR